MILNNKLLEEDITQCSYPLPDHVIHEVMNENWLAVDQYFLEAERPGGDLFLFMRNYLEFDMIEHIISIRTPPDDEDGIWHDDGSRILGFTISLTPNPEEIVGGHLRFRQKGAQDFVSLPIRPFGEMLVFKTGIYGFEHMVSAVTQGKRVLIAGWCS